MKGHYIVFSGSLKCFAKCFIISGSLKTPNCLTFYLYLWSLSIDCNTKIDKARKTSVNKINTPQQESKFGFSLGKAIAIMAFVPHLLKVRLLTQVIILGNCNTMPANAICKIITNGMAFIASKVFFKKDETNSPIASAAQVMIIIVSK